MTTPRTLEVIGNNPIIGVDKTFTYGDKFKETELADNINVDALIAAAHLKVVKAAKK